MSTQYPQGQCVVANRAAQQLWTGQHEAADTGVVGERLNRSNQNSHLGTCPDFRHDGHDHRYSNPSTQAGVVAHQARARCPDPNRERLLAIH